MPHFFHFLYKKFSSRVKNREKINPKTKNNINPYDSYLVELKHLISVTQQDYHILYVGLMTAVENHLKASPEIFHLILQRSITTLKVRRGFMLPKGSDAETCYQQQDSWTYALLSAVWLKDCFSNNQLEWELLEKLMPSSGLNWIKKNESLFSEWLSYLKGEFSENNTFNNIISQSNTLLKKSFLKNPKIIDKDLPPDKSRHQRSILPRVILNEDLSDTTEETKKEEKIKEESFSLTKSKSDTFIEWIKREVADHRLSLNQADSLVQSVETGILLAMPALYNRFLKVNNCSPSAIEKRELLNEIINDERFIRDSKNRKIHTYYQGDWNDRDQIEGLIIAPHFLFAQEAIPPLNSVWQMDIFV